MKRQSLDNGGWFDLESSTVINEGSYWNGNNTISLATGSQWDHENLIVTRKGRFVLNSWSQWQGSGESWQTINENEAAEWLVRNQRDKDELPEAAAALLVSEYESSEV